MENELNPKQELFCQNYVNNRDTFGNATMSYSLAYDIDAVLSGNEEQKANYWTCQANGSRLLLKDIVKSRVTKLLNDLLKDEIVDAELSKVIQQDGELGSKIAAIKEYNKLKQRIIEKSEVDLKGTMQIEGLAQEIKTLIEEVKK